MRSLTSTWNHWVSFSGDLGWEGCQLYLTLPFDAKEAGETLIVVGMEMGWTKTNKVKINPDKMEVLVMGTETALRGGVSTVFDGVALPLQGTSKQ